jgi:hypothetical protein
MPLVRIESNRYLIPEINSLIDWPCSLQTNKRPEADGGRSLRNGYGIKTKGVRLEKR